MKATPKGRKPLAPRKVINVKGKVHYSESNQAWNVIQLRKEIIQEFPQLKEKRSKFAYKMVLHKGETKIDLAIIIYRKPSFIKNQDLDNIAKVILDVLKNNLFYDDRQVERLLLMKQGATQIEGHNTDSLVISFRIHDPSKQMILVDRDVI